MTREKKTINNIISNIVVQVIAAISGFIIPRLILSCFGSTVNGMVNSIGQFLTYAGLVEMGIGNASIAVLYESIVQRDDNKMSIILSSVKKKYLISGCLYTVIIVGLAVIYPLCINEQLDYWFVFSMVMIIALTSIIDFFIIGKYKVLLIADQKSYIINFSKVLATIVSTFLSCLVLISGGSIVLVKVIAVFTHFCEAIYVRTYVKYRYPNVDYCVSDYIELEQQRNALIHRLCMVITYNTDLVILTLFLSGESLKEISVYSVYALAFGVVNNGMSCFTTGIEATYGNMAAKNEVVKLKKIFGIYETGYTYMAYLFYSCFFALIVPFIRCYTHGVTDINYIRLNVGILFGISGMLANIKDAHGVIIKAYGCYKQTQRYVIAEAIVNIIISIILVHSLGIVGVLIGTVFSHFITTIGFIRYADKYLLKRNPYQTLKNNFRNMVIILTLALVEIKKIYYVSDWKAWLINAIWIFVTNAIILFGMNMVTNRENFKIVIEYWKGKMCKKEEKL